MPESPAPRSRPLAALAFLLLFFCTETAQAHRVNIFAWLEGDIIAVECNFRRNAPVKGGSITVLDATDGTEVWSGITDAEGKCTFPVPAVARKGHGLRIRIHAGEGHQNEWHMPAADFAALTSADARPPAIPAASSSPENGQTQQVVTLTREELSAMIHAALERQIAPLRRELAMLSDDGPRLQDIIGGLGWIMGLVGMGLCLTRKRS